MKNKLKYFVIKIKLQWFRIDCSWLLAWDRYFRVLAEIVELIYMQKRLDNLKISDKFLKF